MFNEWDASCTLTVLGLLGGLFAFVFGYFQYRKSQEWKRAEWVATEMTSFFNDKKVQAALTMIDWGERPILLFPDKDLPEEKYFRTSDEIVKHALEFHTQHGPFTSYEAAIRDVFDGLLDRFERFNHFIECKLITQKDIEPYLRYWIKEIGSIKDDSCGVGIERIKQLHAYIKAYNFHGASSLFAKFGYRLISQ